MDGNVNDPFNRAGSSRYLSASLAGAVMFKISASLLASKDAALTVSFVTLETVCLALFHDGGKKEKS